MTTTTPPTPAVRTLGFGNVLRSEWTKLRTLRSTAVCAGAAGLMLIGVSVILGIRWGHQSGQVDQPFDATGLSLSGIYLAQVIVGTIGVLMISSEYTTGMVRATFSAVPQRPAVLATKAIVLAVATFALSELACFAAFFICQALLVPKHAGVSLGDPQVLRAVMGGGLYLTAVALLGFGLGATIRHTAGALSAFFGLLFAPSALVALLPTSWRETLLPYMPANAGSQIFTVIPVHGALGPWAGLGVFCLYALAALAAGLVVVTVRDA